MNIPENVNHRDFWNVAKLKGIKISSRYTGVVLAFNRNGSPAWFARVQDKGFLKSKRFKFTAEGEKAAAEFYKREKAKVNGIKNNINNVTQ